MPIAEVLRLGGIGPQALYSWEQDFASAGVRFRFSERRFDAARRDTGDKLEVAFDGCELRSSTGDATTITTQRELLRQDVATPLFFPDYFDALRIEVGNRSDRVGKLPASTVLREVYRGAQVDRIADSTLLRIREQKDRGITRTTWIDSARNGAVTRIELQHQGKPLVTTINTDFVRIGELFLPRHIEVQRYGWANRQGSLRREPLLVRTIVADPIRADVPADALRFIALRPGSVVIDNRYCGYGNSRDDNMAYWVPIPMPAIRDAFDRVYPPHRTLGLWSFGALHAALLALWWSVCRTRLLSRRKR